MSLFEKRDYFLRAVAGKSPGGEMQSVLPGGDYGAADAFFLKCKTRGQTGESASHYYCLKFHNPRTCL